MNPSQTRPRRAPKARAGGFRLSLIAVSSAIAACNAQREFRVRDGAPLSADAAKAPSPGVASGSGLEPLGETARASSTLRTSATASSSAAPGSSAAPAPGPSSAVATASASAAAAELGLLPEAGAPSPSTHAYAIAAIGDSLTDPRSHGGGYLEYLRSHCPELQIDNFGRGATMVNQMRRSFEANLASTGRHYTHLLVFGGVNDLYSDLTAGRTPAKIESDLSAIYDFGHAHGMRVVAFTVAPWGGFKRYFNESRARATHELNAWIRAQPGAGRVDSVVDAYALLSCGDPDQLCERFFTPFRDGIHFGPEGHQMLGQALLVHVFSDCQ